MASDFQQEKEHSLFPIDRAQLFLILKWLGNGPEHGFIFLNLKLNNLN
jgi:hypothetical protein